MLSITLLAAVFAGGVVFADETFGIIKSVDATAKTVTLSDGIACQMNNAILRYEMVDGYRSRDKVVVTWAVAAPFGGRCRISTTGSMAKAAIPVNQNAS